MKSSEWDIIDSVLSVGATLNQVQWALANKGISYTTRTIQRHIEEKKSMTFSEYRDYCMSGTKIRLQQSAIQMALKGNAVMMIFSLKNLCNWSDKIEQKIEEVPTQELIDQARDIITKFERNQGEPSKDQNLKN